MLYHFDFYEQYKYDKSKPLFSRKRLLVYEYLNSLYGIGLSRSQYICKVCGISFSAHIKLISKKQLFFIFKIFRRSNFLLKDSLARDYKNSIDRLKTIKSYQGLRHILRLSVRGQRTKTNCRTIRTISLKSG